MAALFQTIFEDGPTTAADPQTSSVLLPLADHAINGPFTIDLGPGLEALPIADKKPSRIVWIRLAPKTAIGPLCSEKSTFIGRVISGAKTLTNGIAVRIDDDYKSRMATDTLLQIRANRTFGFRNCSDMESVVIELIEFLDLAGLAEEAKPKAKRRGRAKSKS